MAGGPERRGFVLFLSKRGYDDWAIFDLENAGAKPPTTPSHSTRLLANGRPYHLTDRGNAQRLAAVFGGDLIWCAEWGWGVWNGARNDFSAVDVGAYGIVESLGEVVRSEAIAWAAAPVSASEKEKRLGKELVRTKPRFRTLEESEGWIRAERRAELEKHALTCENVPTIDRALRSLRHLVRVRLDELDANPWSLAVANGAVDLRAVAAERPEAETPGEGAERRHGWLRPHDRAARPTRVCATSFDPTARCPKFEQLPELVQPKPHMRAFLQRALGGLVFGRNDWQVALLLQGEGANGKSTLMNVISSVVGSYAASCQINMFLASETLSSSAATPDEAALPGARLYLASEPEPDARLSDSK